MEEKRLPGFPPPSPNPGDSVPGCDLEKFLFQFLGRELNWMVPNASKSLGFQLQFILVDFRVYEDTWENLLSGLINEERCAFPGLVCFFIWEL